jgi:HlyD family secretion protein
MSVIEAEIEVDETDIPNVKIGQKAIVTIDAIEGRTFPGHVTEIGNSPIQAPAGQAATGQRTATNFKVVVTLDEVSDAIRPGFTCTAEISTDSRSNVVAVPIQALTVREIEYDPTGNVVPKPRPAPRSRFSFGPAQPADAAPVQTELPVGHTRKEVEGVFVIRDGKAQFVEVEVGIAGERYFEVTSGLSAGDRVITGPFDSVRNLYEGDQVRENAPPPAATS